ncbi:MAG: SpoIIE family protein phosphatase [Candidatus Zixiibacteriota bacterium]|nr:MAG: SpoIIE family protein phosphatase [candidate division Zixibacteria bacterium]
METLQPIITAVYFVLGGILLFLSYTIIRDNPGHRTNRITGMMLFFAALGPIFLAFGAIVKPTASAAAPFEDSLLYNVFYVWELFFPSFLLFSWVFPADRLSHIKRRRLRYLIFFPHLFHLLLVLVFRNPEKVLNLLEFESGEGFIALILEPISYLMKWVVLGFSLLLSSEKALFSFINLIYLGMAIYNIIRGKSLVKDQRLRTQSNVIIWGILIAVGMYTASFLIPGLFSIDLSPDLQTAATVLLLFVGGGSISWSIIRHRFLDVRVIFRQSLVYTITSGILVGLYILVFGQADKLITRLFGAQTNIVNIAFIVLALILYQPIMTRLDNLIQKFFIRSRTDYRNVLEQLSRSLISIFDPEQVRAMIEKTLKSTLFIERIYFVLFDDTLQEYVLLASEDFPGRIILNRDDIFLGAIGQRAAPITIDQLEAFRQGSALAYEMEKRRGHLLLPLKDADHLLGFLALTKKASGYQYNAEDITMLGVISNQLVTVLTNARLYADSLEKQRLDEEMVMARQIQLDLLPKNPPRSKSFDLHAYSKPSRIIGGDFYDFIPMDNGAFAMVIADASGKGMPAALLVAQIQAMLRSEVGNENDLSRILFNVNRYVAESTSAEKYATLFYGEFSPLTREFRYANAGHNYPILMRADGSHQFLEKGGMLIGAFSGAKYQMDTVRLAENDLLLFYTDGVTEAQNESDEEFGERRILDFLVRERHLGPVELIDGILEEIRQFDHTDPPRDDTTLIVLKVKNGASG